jgi:hypothetical protein
MWGAFYEGYFRYALGQPVDLLFGALIGYGGSQLARYRIVV